MNFDNLTDEQITWLESKIQEAYEEGYEDCHLNKPDHWHHGRCDSSDDYDSSLAKNETRHILVARYMAPVEDK